MPAHFNTSATSVFPAMRSINAIQRLIRQTKCIHLAVYTYTLCITQSCACCFTTCGGEVSSLLLLFFCISTQCTIYTYLWCFKETLYHLVAASSVSLSMPAWHRHIYIVSVCRLLLAQCPYIYVRVNIYNYRPHQI